MVDNFKSNFEELVATTLKQKGVKFGYETTKLPFLQPEKKRVYKPDFELPETACFIETKGKLTVADRQKMVWIKEQYPNLRIVILFQRADNFIRRGSKTRYSDWADSVGIEWADWHKDGIPTNWLKIRKPRK